MVQEYLKSEQIQKAIGVLRGGGVVVFPTETAYGLAADATNEAAVERVCKIKGRVPESLPIIAATREMAESIGHIPQVLRQLADQYWPGPLTLLVPAVSGVLAPGIIKNDQIAVRVSSHQVAQALSAGLGVPIVSTSANVSGQPTGYSVTDVQAQFSNQPHQPDLYIDVGKLDPLPPSTIAGLDELGKLKIYRQGSIRLS